MSTQAEQIRKLKEEIRQYKMIIKYQGDLIRTTMNRIEDWEKLCKQKGWEVSKVLIDIKTDIESMQIKITCRLGDKELREKRGQVKFS